MIQKDKSEADQLEELRKAHFRDWVYSQYLRQFYYLFVTLSSVGYGEITPTSALLDNSNKERDNIEYLIDITWAIWMILFGLMVFSYLSGRIMIQIEKISDETPLTVQQVMDTIFEGIDGFFIEHNTNEFLSQNS